MNRRLAANLDRALEATVLLSFGSAGYELRRRLFGWPESPAGVEGRVVAVTGADTAVGLATVTALAAGGARIWLVDAAGVDDAEQRRRTVIAATGNPAVHLVTVTNADRSSVREGAARLRADAGELDAVVHAGLGGRCGGDGGRAGGGPGGAALAELATAHLLTAALLPALGSGARLVWSASPELYTARLRVEALPAEGPPPCRSGGQMARATVTLARAWAERLGDRGVAVHAAHSGWVDQPDRAACPWPLEQGARAVLRSPGQAADTLAWLVSAPEAARRSGDLWLDRRPRPHDRVPWTRVSARDRDRLWQVVTALSGAADLLEATSVNTVGA